MIRLEPARIESERGNWGRFSRPEGSFSQGLFDARVREAGPQQRAFRMGGLLIFLKFSREKKKKKNWKQIMTRW